MGRKECRQACYFSAAQPQKSKAGPYQESWRPQIVRYVQHTWHADAVYEMDMVKAQDIGQKLYHTFSLAC